MNVFTSRSDRSRPRTKNRPRLESLEGRQLMSLGSEFSAPVNTTTRNMNRYSASGGLLGSSFIETSTAFESRPSVSMDKAGNAVVAWQRQTFGNNDVIARRVTASGVLGAEVAVAATSFSEESPKVALKPAGGSYVVVYNGFDQTSEHVRVAEVSASDTVTTLDAGVRSDPSVSINAAGQYVVTYTSNDGGDLNIRRRIGHI